MLLSPCGERNNWQCTEEKKHSLLWPTGVMRGFTTAGSDTNHPDLRACPFSINCYPKKLLEMLAENSSFPICCVGPVEKVHNLDLESGLRLLISVIE